jgi:hypothetical protein
MDEKFYMNLLEKAIVASNSNPEFIKTKGFFKWRFYTVEELNKRIVSHNEKVEQGRGDLQNNEFLPLKTKGKTSLTRYDRIKTYPSNENTENTRSDIFLINELSEKNIFYAIHASFVGTNRYKFKLTEDNKVEFINNKMILIR